MWQVTVNPVIPIMPASSVVKWATLPEIAPNREHAPTLSISTLVWMNPYQMTMSSTRRIESAPSEPTWLPSPLTKNNTLLRKWVARIFPVLD